VEFESYLQDASGYRGEADRVFVPDSVRELREIVAQCARERIPMTVAGAGTGLTGARVPHGGAVLSVERFRKLEVENGRAICGAGVALEDLHRAAAKHRQFLGPNPTESSASVGGVVSTNAGGARSFRYQSLRYQVLGLEVTFADGRTERFRRGDKVDFAHGTVRQPETTKNSAGYYLKPDVDWVELLAGSEGTLGIVTEIELALQSAPGAILSGVVFFPSETEAFDAVEAWRGLGELRLLEFMDEAALLFLRERYPEIPAGARTALFVEQNLESEEDPEVEHWAERLTVQGALEETWFGFRESEQARFREFRHMLAVLVTETVRRNGFPKCATDFAVPIARNRELHNFYKQRCEEEFPSQYTIFGHVGDANNHINLLPRTVEQAKKAEHLIHEFAEKVVSKGGTVAAEHGIGKTKIGLLRLMYGGAEIEKMREVKRKLDPEWLLGRGTLFEAPPR
jgi:FAD/FMN-containing dehydrogenase